MLSYFGTKTKIIQHYPEPDHDRIREPFCGMARYALRYFERDVWINDEYPIIAKAWQWITQASRQEIHALPVLKVGQDLREIKSLSEGERIVLGFTVNQGAAYPRNVVTKRAKHSIPRLKVQLLKYCGLLRHWRVTCGCYSKMVNSVATWYVDPPYQFMGAHHYVHSSDKINYPLLGRWCQERQGQVIVCEGKGANWLPFVKLIAIRKDTMRPDEKKKKGDVEYNEVVYHRRTLFARTGTLGLEDN